MMTSMTSTSVINLDDLIEEYNLNGMIDPDLNELTKANSSYPMEE
ncbi:13105_t:CDS:1, partial [Gigaspora rosea]